MLFEVSELNIQVDQGPLPLELKRAAGVVLDDHQR